MPDRLKKVPDQGDEHFVKKIVVQNKVQKSEPVVHFTNPPPLPSESEPPLILSTIFFLIKKKIVCQTARIDQ